MLRKNRECIFTGYILFTLVHLFRNSDISAYDFHIENSIVEEMISLTFLVLFHFSVL